jgi:hypothetical protein
MAEVRDPIVGIQIWLKSKEEFQRIRAHISSSYKPFQKSWHHFISLRIALDSFQCLHIKVVKLHRHVSERFPKVQNIVLTTKVIDLKACEFESKTHLKLHFWTEMTVLHAVGLLHNGINYLDLESIISGG